MNTSHFFRFHYLQATLLFLFCYITFKLVMIAGIIGFSATRLLGLTQGQLLVQQGLGWVVVVTQWLIILIASSQALVCLLGKTPRIPVVTPNVTYWA